MSALPPMPTLPDMVTAESNAQRAGHRRFFTRTLPAIGRRSR